MENNNGTWTKSLSNGIKKFASGFKSILTNINSQRNEGILLWCAYSMFVDPIFLYTPVIDDDKKCFTLDDSLNDMPIMLRLLMDFLFFIDSVLILMHEFKQDSRVSPSLLFLFDLSIVLPLPQLISFGQGLPLSINIWENIFVMCITITGVGLFFFLMAKVESEMSKWEETRHKIEEMDRWQPFASLPKRLQNQVKKHQSSFKWRETYRGVDVESLLNNLPKDLIKNIKQELFRNLRRNVDEFRNWNEALLEELCECDALKPAVFTERSYIVRQGDAIDQMLFVIQGQLWSYTINNMNNGHVGVCCGEELIAWARDHRDPLLPNYPLRISTRTIQAITNVEAFVVMADDLKKVVMNQNNAARVA